MQFAGGVTTVQLNPIALDEDAVAVKPVGADGTALQPPEPPGVVADAWRDAPDEPNPSAASTM